MNFRQGGEPTEYFLGSVIFNVVIHFPYIYRYPGVSINIRHIEAQQEYQNGRVLNNEDWDSMDFFMTLKPSDRQAAARLRLVMYLLDVLPEIAPSGAIPPGKLPRLASEISDTILKGMKMEGKDLKEVVSFFTHKLMLIRKSAPLITGLLKEIAKDMPSSHMPSSSTVEHASDIRNAPHSSSGTTLDLRGCLVEVVADVLLDLAPSIGPSRLPAIAIKVTDNILSGGVSNDVVPSRSEVLSLVQARMGLVKGLIKKGKPQPSPAAGSHRHYSNTATLSDVLLTDEEVEADLRPKLMLLLPELVPEVVRYGVIVHVMTRDDPCLVGKNNKQRSDEKRCNTV